MSQYLKNPDVVTVLSKTRSTDPEPRRRECPGRQHGNNSTDDTTADNTDSSAECDMPIHRATSPKAPQMTNSPPAVAPQHPTTPTLSAITTHSPNSPTVHSEIINPPTPKPIAAGGSRDPRSLMQIILAKLETNGVRAPAPNSPTRFIQQEAQLTCLGKLVVGVMGKNSELFFFIILKQFYHRFTHIS